MSDEDSDINEAHETFEQQEMDCENIEDDKNDEDDILDENANYVTVIYEKDDEKKHFEIDENTEFKDIRNKLNDDISPITTDHRFVVLNEEYDEEYDLFQIVNGNDNDDDEDDDDFYNNDKYTIINDTEKCIEYNKKNIIVKWMYFKVKIVDGLDLEFDVKVTQTYTIAMIKEQIDKNKSIKINQLSFKGQELQNNESLQTHNIKENGHKLISRISIKIDDLECELSTDLLVCDFWDIETVINTYLDTERREMHKNAKIFYEDQELNKSESVYNLGMRNRSKLEYKVGEYPILIFDSHIYQNPSKNLHLLNKNENGIDANAIKVDVYDYWTLDQVKSAYARLTKKPFLEKEQLLSQERQLEDNIKLWKLRIRDHEKLFIEREQYDIVTEYTCCECNNPVMLRKKDRVQCRECFHQVVFKKRTKRVCQYNCR